MKILIVCQFYYPENFVISKIAEKLASYGHEVDVLTGKPNYGYGHILPEYKNIKEQTINGVNVYRVNISPRKHSRLSIIKNYLSFWFNSKKWVRKCSKKYDVVYSMSLSPVTILAAGNLYKKKHGVPHVVHCVDLWPESTVVTNAVKKDGLIYKMLYKWSKKLYEKADEIIIGSPSFEEYFDKVLNIHDIPLTYIPQPSLMEDNNLPPFSFDKNYFNILYCGNLGIIQLIDLIPEAMKILKDTPVKFHIIGMGPMSDKLCQAIDKYDLKEKIIYYGPLSAYNSSVYFKGADALYVSLKNEGYVGKTIPNKLVMSMAFGKPIVATLGGDGKDILLESNGATFSEEDPRSLARAILSLMAFSEKERMMMGKNNLTYYKNNLTIDIISKKIEKELLNKGR